MANWPFTDHYALFREHWRETDVTGGFVSFGLFTAFAGTEQQRSWPRPLGAHSIYSWIPVSPEDAMIVVLGLCYSDMLSHVSKSNVSAVVFTSDRGRTWNDTPALPSGQWTVEADANLRGAVNFKRLLREKLIEETFRDAHNHYIDEIERLNLVDITLIRDEARRAIIETEVNQKLVAARSEAKAFATAYQELSYDFDRAFSEASTMEQCMAVARQFVPGEFLKDWHMPEWYNGHDIRLAAGLADSLGTRPPEMFDSTSPYGRPNYFSDSKIKGILKNYRGLAPVYRYKQKLDYRGQTF